MTAMADATRPHVWGNIEAYEAYMGRWSRPMAKAFLAWLAPSPLLRWLDVGCGTGALTQAILSTADPSEILGINFVPEPELAVAEMVRATRHGGSVGAYVWDYGGEMQLVRTFWQAAIALDPAAAAWDQARQFPICQPESLEDHFRRAGLTTVAVQAIDIPTLFRDLDDYWRPHLLQGSGVAPRYVTSLEETQRAALQERLQATLPIAADGSIPLIARAWAVRGVR
jgi:hypothetical protein